ncbi:Fungalysin metallopeptidase-domain-containing protein [Syncephalis plumigaleata]|nr:Fungalysin metallopeptidase-domain-containing protein [Syncephalis plumigaleata]
MFRSSSMGITHIHCKQVIQGVEVSNARISVHVDDQGEVVVSEDNFYKNTNPAKLQLWQGPSSTRFTNPTIAFAKLADHIKKPVNVAAIVNAGSKMVNGSKLYILRNIPGTVEDVTAKQRYVQTASGNLGATWAFSVNYGSNYFDAHVSADGQRLVSISDRTSFFSYNVFKFGDTDPSKDKRVLIKDPEDKNASPAGWHEVSRQNTITTEGNNVVAEWYEEYESDINKPVSTNGVFDYPYDANKSLLDNRKAAVTNMFYTLNKMHDVSLRYGFTEEAGNFQKVNFNKERKGKGNDAVYAVAQDALSFNGAFFRNMPDGKAPYMSIGIWNTFKPARDGALVNDVLVHEYGHGITGRLVEQDDDDAQCISKNEGKGIAEGWSDFFAMWAKAKATDTRSTNVQIAEYLGKGDRPYPYSTNPKDNPMRFGLVNIMDPLKRYEVGVTWGNILFQIYWLYVDKFGFTEKKEIPDMTKGNSLVFQLIMDSVKMTPCQPTFAAAREAILVAEARGYTKGKLKCDLERIFASRGLGRGAKFDATGKPVESTVVSPGC